MSNILTNNTIKNYQNSGILIKKRLLNTDNYRLKRPIIIVIKKSVLDQLKAIYQPSFERGGLVLFRNQKGNILEGFKFIEVPNAATNSVSYSPSTAKFSTEIQNALGGGFLPMAIHTHPTSIGLHAYDTKKQRFYLRASKADISIANSGITDILEVPEMIFVKDTRFAQGYDLAMYSGTIFPQTVSSLSDAQIGLGIVGGIGALFNRFTKTALTLIGAWFLIEFSRRPKYEYQSNGDLVITVNY